MFCLAAIAAAQYAHLKHFPDIEAYGVYYDFQNDISNIGVETFATRMQELLVIYLRQTYGDACANWAESFWTGSRGRMCLAHCRYSGCNNNMGVEVSWRLIKELCSALCSLSTFLGHLVHFIRTALGEEHRKLLSDAGTPNAFIRSPVATKEMWVKMQERHDLTLSCCFIIPASNKIGDESSFSTVMEQVMLCGDDDTPLHLKLVLFHEECARKDQPLGMKIADMKTVLMPKQRVLKCLDPDGTQTVDQLRAKLAPLARLYSRVVLQDILPADVGLEEALGVYRNWHMLTYRADWEENEIPVACTCKTCFNNGICGDVLLYAAVFEPRVRVPADYIAKSVPERKARKSARGTAGKKRLRILAEMKDDEKIVDSKVKYMKGTQPPPVRALPAKPAGAGDGAAGAAGDGAAGANNDTLRIPSPVLPSEEDEEEEGAQVVVCY